MHHTTRVTTACAMTLGLAALSGCEPVFDPSTAPSCRCPPGDEDRFDDALGCVDEESYLEANPPGPCNTDYTPQCGCNGQTYPNDCSARELGIDIAAPGECP